MAIVPKLLQVEVAVDDASWWLETGVPILITVGVAALANVVLRLLVRRFQRRLETAPPAGGGGNIQRATTLAHAVSATLVVTIWTVAVLVVLGYLNVSLAPLIASAGIAGVALGFGAQSIVKDGLSGFFILLENQFGVGDTVEIQSTANPVAGRIEWFTLRATALRAYDGTLHIVPNGNIQVVSNKSRGWARAIVDLRFAYGQDPEQVRGILEELFDELRTDPQLQEWVKDGPTVLGVETTSDYAVVIRATAETLPSKRFDVERLVRARATQRLAERGISAPMPPPVAPRGGEPGRPQ
ncbi:MAG TPA: mechanosensitive ion channel family protein [Actinomycetota bacterium]|nr:mechanosensitive ion channel family protein [Actinomycetota bacterium]